MTYSLPPNTAAPAWCKGRGRGAAVDQALRTGSYTSTRSLTESVIRELKVGEINPPMTKIRPSSVTATTSVRFEGAAASVIQLPLPAGSAVIPEAGNIKNEIISKEATSVSH